MVVLPISGRARERRRGSRTEMAGGTLQLGSLPDDKQVTLSSDIDSAPGYPQRAALMMGGAKTGGHIALVVTDALTIISGMNGDSSLSFQRDAFNSKAHPITPGFWLDHGEDAVHVSPSYGIVVRKGIRPPAREYRWPDVEK